MSTMTIVSQTRHAGASRKRTRAHASDRGRSTGLVVLEVVLLVAIILALIAGVVVTSGRVHAQVPTSRVFVESGQTLWAVAARHPVAGQTTEQTAELIAEINGLRGGRVIAGDSIAVPAEQTDQVLAALR